MRTWGETTVQPSREMSGETNLDNNLILDFQSPELEGDKSLWSKPQSVRLGYGSLIRLI